MLNRLFDIKCLKYKFSKSYIYQTVNGFHQSACITPNVGTNPLSRKIMSMFSDTYIERSPSGKGYHILFFSRLDKLHTDTLLEFPDKYIKKISAVNSNQLKLTARKEDTNAIDVNSRLEIAINASNGNLFSTLYTGDTSAYNSTSEAVQAFACVLLRRLWWKSCKGRLYDFCISGGQMNET